VILPDVNILIYAYRQDATDHERYRAWLEDAAVGDRPIGLADVVLSGLVRIVSHPRIFRPPSPIADALGFVEDLFAQPTAVRLGPGARHWGIFARLCRESGARGNLVPDAYLAALALEQGCELVTTDADFARFKGLRWRHPLA
jgi:toxin-antitoxin system PIN domain toxin